MMRELREETGISQRSAAREAGVCRATLRKIEDGTSTATTAHIEALLRVYGYELEAVKTVCT
jgi:transcriptional regulator with XRE-family HTH domain